MRTFKGVFLAFFILLLFLFGFNFTSVYAQTTLTGKGTAEEPYLISTADELKAVAELINSPTTNSLYRDKNYKLIANISLEGIIEPIGASKKTYFAGTFDGNGHTISNLNVKVGEYMGLFGWLNKAEVYSLALKKVTVDCDSLSRVYCGGLTGYAVNSVFKDCQVELCSVKVSAVTAYCGAIAGYFIDSQSAAASRIVNCAVSKYDAQVSVTSKGYCGGICGYTKDSIGSIFSIENVFVNQTDLSAKSNLYSGTLIGYAYKTDLKQCFYNNSSAVFDIGNSNNTSAQATSFANDDCFAYGDNLTCAVGVISTLNSYTQPHNLSWTTVDNLASLSFSQAEPVLKFQTQNVGDALDPQLLCGTDDWLTLCQLVNSPATNSVWSGKHYALAVDIDLTSLPTDAKLGVSSCPFSGSIDGRGHSIRSKAQVFGCLVATTATASLSNITFCSAALAESNKGIIFEEIDGYSLINCRLEIASETQTVQGRVFATIGSDCLISNCIVKTNCAQIVSNVVTKWIGSGTNNSYGDNFVCVNGCWRKCDLETTPFDGETVAFSKEVSRTLNQTCAQHKDYLLFDSKCEFITLSLTEGEPSFNGLGTKDEPYTIGNATQMGQFVQAVNDGRTNERNVRYGDCCFKLIGDIDLDGLLWKQIDVFGGVFDGNGYSIINFRSDSGLFGVCSDNSEIVNLRLEVEVLRAAKSYCCLFCDVSYGKIVNCMAQINCSVSVEKEFFGIAKQGKSVKNCLVNVSANAVISAQTKQAFTFNGNVSNCYCNDTSMTLNGVNTRYVNLNGRLSDGVNDKAVIVNSLEETVGDQGGYTTAYEALNAWARAYEGVRWKVDKDGIYSFSNDWVDYRSDSIAYGDGTTANPYLIATEQDLALFAYWSNETDNVVEAYAKLLCDVDLSGKNWTPIGYARQYRGVFDGNFHTISGLNLACEQGASGSLFGTCGKVRNLNVTNVTVRNSLLPSAILGSECLYDCSNCSINVDLNADCNNVYGFFVNAKSISNSVCVVRSSSSLEFCAFGKNVETITNCATNASTSFSQCDNAEVLAFEQSNAQSVSRVLDALNIKGKMFFLDGEEIRVSNRWTDLFSPIEPQGNGSQETPYLIGNVNQLIFFCDAVNNTSSNNMYADKHFVLTADIDLDGYIWTPIGSYELPFLGVFDGQGHSVSNMNAEYCWHNTACSGLFGCSKGRISNLVMRGNNSAFAYSRNKDGNSGLVTGIGNVNNCLLDCMGTVTSISNIDYGNSTCGAVSGSATLTLNCVVGGNVKLIGKGKNVFVGAVSGFCDKVECCFCPSNGEEFAGESISVTQCKRSDDWQTAEGNNSPLYYLNGNRKGDDCFWTVDEYGVKLSYSPMSLTVKCGESLCDTLAYGNEYAVEVCPALTLSASNAEVVNGQKLITTVADGTVELTCSYRGRTVLTKQFAATKGVTVSTATAEIDFANEIVRFAPNTQYSLDGTEYFGASSLKLSDLICSTNKTLYYRTQSSDATLFTHGSTNTLNIPPRPTFDSTAFSVDYANEEINFDVTKVKATVEQRDLSQVDDAFEYCIGKTISYRLLATDSSFAGEEIQIKVPKRTEVELAELCSFKQIDVFGGKATLTLKPGTEYKIGAGVWTTAQSSVELTLDNGQRCVMRKRNGNAPYSRLFEVTASQPETFTVKVKVGDSILNVTACLGEKLNLGQYLQGVKGFFSWAGEGVTNRLSPNATLCVSGETVVEAQLRKSALMQGKLVSEDNLSVEGMEVTLKRGCAVVSTSVCDDEGLFSFGQGAEGIYTIEVDDNCGHKWTFPFIPKEGAPETFMLTDRDKSAVLQVSADAPAIAVQGLLQQINDDDNIDTFYTLIADAVEKTLELQEVFGCEPSGIILDLQLHKQSNNEEAQVVQPSSLLSIVVELGSALAGKPIEVLRRHNGVVSLLPYGLNNANQYGEYYSYTDKTITLNVMQLSYFLIKEQVAEQTQPVPKAYELTYLLDGGEFVDSPLDFYFYGDNFTLPQPQRNGYEFVGWQVGNDFVTKVDGSFASDLILNAVWRKQTKNEWFTPVWQQSNGRMVLVVAEGYRVTYYRQDSVVQAYVFGDEGYVCRSTFVLPREQPKQEDDRPQYLPVASASALTLLFAFLLIKRRRIRLMKGLVK